MNFHSILFTDSKDGVVMDTAVAPPFFPDLNLDQLVEAITADKEEYNLTPFFYTPLTDSDAIHYRQEVAQDLESKPVAAAINTFAEKMVVMRRYLGLSQKLYDRYHIEGWFLEAVDMYCQAITGLEADLRQTAVQSRGLQAFQEYLTHYAASETFTSLRDETQQIKADLATVSYCILIKGDLVRVRKYEEEIDYSVDVQETFQKFQQGAVKDYRVKLYTGGSMNHVEARILNLVARLYPEIFAALDGFYGRRQHFVDEIIQLFDREIQFYVAYLEHIASVKRTGLHFCYPRITGQNKDIYSESGFDLALATKRASEKITIVPNDFYLSGPERILIVSGPNQGGKTTFARAYGQLHYLACLGLPVPGTKAQLFLFDKLFTHFEKEENIKNLRGKLQDDLVRIHAILDRATPRSILIMNEIFASTTLQDAVFLSNQIMERISHLDLLCVWVTFIDELAAANEKTVSMVSTVVPDNPAIRTYKILRRPADGLAYAMSIAEKYRLTYDCIKERINA